ncbi:MAG: KH domain-containing protein [Candidatus Woesearchaeota archaeon]|nr:KH domain-containing protein [Candidatus Woesearchaeota archaeon]
MQEFRYELIIPKERIAVLIGKKGEVKKALEANTNTKLNIDSREGTVKIEGKDAIRMFNTQEVVKAIGRGFNPDIAMQLLKADYIFELIDLKDYVKDKKNHLIRLKGRVIGENGKSRRIIEELTESAICIYGKTIGIIGEAGHVSVAKRAVESLLKGSPHSTVYRWLEKQRKELKRKEMFSEEIELKESVKKMPQRDAENAKHEKI